MSVTDAYPTKKATGEAGPFERHLVRNTWTPRDSEVLLEQMQHLPGVTPKERMTPEEKVYITNLVATVTKGQPKTHENVERMRKEIVEAYRKWDKRRRQKMKGLSEQEQLTQDLEDERRDAYFNAHKHVLDHPRMRAWNKDMDMMHTLVGMHLEWQDKKIDHHKRRVEFQAGYMQLVLMDSKALFIQAHELWTNGQTDPETHEPVMMPSPAGDGELVVAWPPKTRFALQIECPSEVELRQMTVWHRPPVVPVSVDMYRFRLAKHIMTKQETEAELLKVDEKVDADLAAEEEKKQANPDDDDNALLPRKTEDELDMIKMARRARVKAELQYRIDTHTQSIAMLEDVIHMLVSDDAGGYTFDPEIHFCYVLHTHANATDFGSPSPSERFGQVLVSHGTCHAAECDNMDRILTLGPLPQAVPKCNWCLGFLLEELPARPMCNKHPDLHFCDKACKAKHMEKVHPQDSCAGREKLKRAAKIALKKKMKKQAAIDALRDKRAEETNGKKKLFIPSIDLTPEQKHEAEAKHAERARARGLADKLDREDAGHLLDEGCIGSMFDEEKESTRE